VSEFRALFFDGFGTLFDAADVPAKAMQLVAREIRVDPERLGDVWLRLSQEQDRAAAPFRTMREHFAASFRGAFDVFFPGVIPSRELVERCVDLDIACIQDVVPYPSAIDRVRELAEYMPLALVTNADDDFVSSVLQRNPMPFTHVQTSEAAGGYKPAPSIFAAAADALGISGSDILMIGDSWREDIEGAVNFGASAIWINRSRKPLPPSAPPQLLAEIADLDELPAVLESVLA
jgi:2-haloalkanoic acid dehalogenase type II